MAVQVLLLQGDGPLIGHGVGEQDSVHLAGVQNGALGLAALAGDAVDGAADGVAVYGFFRDGIPQAEGQIPDADVLAVLQGEFIAGVDHQVAVNFLAVLVILGVGVVVQHFVAGLVIKLDVEIELLAGLILAHHLLADLQVAGFLLDVHPGHGGQGEVHVAGGAGGAALGIEEGQGMGLGFGASVPLQVVPQIHILAHGGVDAADVAHQLVIQEHPHIIVAEEVVFQGPHVVRRQGELHGVLHPEEAVVVVAVIAAGEASSRLLPDVRFARVLPLRIGIVTVKNRRILAKQRVGSIGCSVQGPEVVGENRTVRCRTTG